MICHRGGNLAPFSQEIHNLYTKNCETWKQGKFKREKLLRLLRIGKEQEIAQNAKSSSKTKKIGAGWCCLYAILQQLQM